MSVISLVTTPEEYAALTWFVREGQNRGFGWLVAELFQDSSGIVTRGDLLHFGNLAHEIGRSGVGEERQGKHLNRLGVLAADYFGVRGANENHPVKPFVDALFELGNRREHRRQGYRVAESDEAWAFCAMISAAMLAMVIGATAEEIDEDPQMFAEIACKYASDTGRPVLANYINAIQRDIARWGSAGDWVSPEAVGRMREALRDKPVWTLIQTLLRRSNGPLEVLHMFAYHLHRPQNEKLARRARNVN